MIVDICVAIGMVLVATALSAGLFWHAERDRKRIAREADEHRKQLADRAAKHRAEILRRYG